MHAVLALALIIAVMIGIFLDLASEGGRLPRLEMDKSTRVNIPLRCTFDHLKVIERFKVEGSSVISELLQYGHDLEAGDESGRTLLITSAEGNLPLLSLALLTRGANPLLRTRTVFRHISGWQTYWLGPEDSLTAEMLARYWDYEGTAAMIRVVPDAFKVFSLLWVEKNDPRSLSIFGVLPRELTEYIVRLVADTQ